MDLVYMGSSPPCSCFSTFMTPLQSPERMQSVLQYHAPYFWNLIFCYFRYISFICQSPWAQLCWTEAASPPPPPLPISKLQHSPEETMYSARVLFYRLFVRITVWCKATNSFLFIDHPWDLFSALQHVFLSSVPAWCLILSFTWAHNAMQRLYHWSRKVLVKIEMVCGLKGQILNFFFCACLDVCFVSNM